MEVSRNRSLGHSILVLCFGVALSFGSNTVIASCEGLVKASWNLNVKKVKNQLDQGQQLNCTYGKKMGILYPEVARYYSPLTAVLTTGHIKRNNAKKAKRIFLKLLDAGADVNFSHTGQSPRKNPAVGMSPLFVATWLQSISSDSAIRETYLEFVEILLDYGANVNPSAPEISEQYFSLSAERVRKRHYPEFSKFSILDSCPGLFKFSKCLMSDDKRVWQQGTPLMIAAQANNLALVKLLVSKGADTTTANVNGDTAYSLAERYTSPNSETVRYLAVSHNKNKAKLVEEKNELEKLARNAVHLKRQKEKQQRIQKTIERDSRLPAQARKDKYLVALTSRLMDERYGEVLFYFELIAQSGAELDRSFNYFYGEALLRTGQPEQALEKFYSYIELTGAKGQHYTDALNLINEAEEQL